MISNSDEYTTSRIKLIDEIYNTFIDAMKTDPEGLPPDVLTVIVSGKLAELDNKLRPLYKEQLAFDALTDMRTININ